MKAGRKKIECLLGDLKRHTIACYDYEWTLLQIEFEKIKRQRPKYYINKDEK